MDGHPSPSLPPPTTPRHPPPTTHPLPLVLVCLCACVLVCLCACVLDGMDGNPLTTMVAINDGMYGLPRSASCASTRTLCTRGVAYQEWMTSLSECSLLRRRVISISIGRSGGNCHTQIPDLCRHSVRLCSLCTISWAWWGCQRRERSQSRVR